MLLEQEDPLPGRERSVHVGGGHVTTVDQREARGRALPGGGSSTIDHVAR